ncbi:restriction endonuclease [Bacillus sp. FJAT-49711]|uniref:type II restriction endonuclease n=1 Tax=Bacillus sp. FJAT-49711 TaxID=2833585 RepID=UPI001BC9F29F|nr:type II restriction endonuclease [Bacillus sp. FJAT-49711]MBS4218326.1 restriction endonuclease [Bacillus sp. FJAT-49711]
MKKGFLSQYFEGIAIKRLSSVEVDIRRSNQHEFNGSVPLRNLLGNNRLSDYPVTFIWLGDENEGISEEGYVTWYDAREKHPSRTEWRLYFKSNSVIDLSQEGDLLLVAKRPDNQVYIIVIKADSTFENQLLWLFGINDEINFQFNFQPIENGHNPKVDFAVRYILEELGIQIQEPDSVFLDTLIEPYIDKGFPSTKEFSALARRSVDESYPVEQPDLTLVKWIEQEEKLFKRLERHIVSDMLKQGFHHSGLTDVDGFIKFSLSVHNRRKSRVGYALENHLQEIFKRNGIKHSRGTVTENKSKPDFLFPDIMYYKDPSFPVSKLTMLGVKSTCKDRWRQVLAEASKIDIKHLFTLEPGITENQTSEMQSSNLRLILPQPLHETYSSSQQTWLMNLDEFIHLVRERQIGY